MNESSFAFRAPQYYDFTSFHDENSDEIEQYFEQDHELMKDKEHVEEIIYIDDNVEHVEEIIYIDDDLEQEYYSLIAEEVEIDDVLAPNKLRRSFSTGNILKSWQSTILKNDTEKETNIKEKEEETKNFLRSSSSTALLKQNRNSHAFVSQEWLNKLAQPKYNFHKELRSSQFISMAEAVQRFQKATPERFHSKNVRNNSVSITVDHNIPKQPTIPKSPSLYTRTRTRSANILSREEREIMEFEEAQKNKFSSHPVNRKILRSPVPLKVQVEKKPITVPEPFHLSQGIKKEPVISDKEEFTFHANPIPKGLLDPVEKPIIKKRPLTTQPKTPALLRRYHAQMQEKAEKLVGENVLTRKSSIPTSTIGEQKEECLDKNGKRCTEVRPFSFEERDKQIQKKKEEALQKLIEEEKKMRQFHANPLPKFLHEKKFSSIDVISTKLFEKPEKPKNQMLNITNPFKFKSRPAKVLQTKPFEPQKSTKPLSEIPNFELNTDRRAKERQMYEERLKERDELIAAQKLKMEEEKLREEEKKIAHLRRMTEHKAQPIRRYKPIEPVPMKSLTEPQSPKFHCPKRNNTTYHNDNKENITE